MPDDAITVLIAGDASGLTTALNKGAKDVSGFAGQTKAAFESVAAADTATSKQVQANTAETLKGFVNLRQGGIFAMDALRAKYIEATSEVARLKNEILETNDAATLGKLNEELRVAQKEMSAARTSMRALNMEARETTEKANLLGEAVGVKLPGALGRLIGQMPAVQTAMAAAFQVGIVLFAISMIGELIEKFGELTEELGGFGKEAKKNYEEILDFNQKLLLRSLEVKDKLEKVATIGKEGAAKYAIEAKNAEESTKRWGIELGRANSEFEKAKKELEDLQSRKSLVDGPFAGLTGLNRQIDELTGRVKRLKEERDELDLKDRDKPVEKKTADAEERARRRSEIQKDNEAKLTTEREYGEALLSFEEAAYKRSFSLAESSIEQEIAQLKDAETRKLALEESTNAKLRALKVKEGASTGRDVSADLLAMDEKIAAQRIDSAKKQQDLDAQLKAGQIARAKETSDAEINAQERVTEASLQSSIERERFAMQQANTVRQVEVAAADLIKSETTLFESQFQALQAKAAGLVSTLSESQRPTAKFGTNEFAQQLEDIKNLKPKLYAELIEMNAHQIALHSELAAKILKIDDDTAKKSADIRIKDAERDLEATTKRANRELEAATKSDNDRLQHQQITLGKWEQQEFDALNRWYAVEIASVKRAEEVIAAAHGKEGDDFKKLKEREIELEQQYAIKVQQIEQKVADQRAQLIQRMNQAFTSEVNSVILGQQRIGQAAAHLGQQLELYIIDQGIKKVVTNYGGKLLEMLTAHSSFLQSILGIETAGDAKKLAQAKISQLAQVTADAGVAGAAGFASVMEAVPFPENIALAPEIAADAAGETMAFGAYEKGGIVPGTRGQAVPILAHAGEGVLPQRLTSMLHSVANSSVDNSRASTTIHNSPQIAVHQHGGSMDPAEITRAVRKGLRYGHSIGLPRV